MGHIEKAREIANQTHLREGFGRPLPHEVAAAQLHALIAIYDVLAPAPPIDVQGTMETLKAAEATLKGIR
ncbi:hypothetical protein [Nocardia wallacei]|uniref:hypothetical protein n=1 Tax=Nocardia wallacei TaxID=480035 RepID=UPI00245891A5|nr:hypothetical protein [Nocardia wallacei]